MDARSGARGLEQLDRVARRVLERGAPWSFEALLRELVDAETYPRLHRPAWSRADEAPDEHAEFLFGLERILDGVEALIG